MTLLVCYRVAIIVNLTCGPAHEILLILKKLCDRNFIVGLMGLLWLLDFIRLCQRLLRLLWRRITHENQNKICAVLF